MLSGSDRLLAPALKKVGLIKYLFGGVTIMWTVKGINNISDEIFGV